MGNKRKSDTAKVHAAKKKVSLFTDSKCLACHITGKHGMCCGNLVHLPEVYTVQPDRLVA